jgi:XRE family transcriptional regulator, regulator of sulfur utilization
MKALLSSACFLLVASTMQAQASAPSPPRAAAKLGSTVFEWRELKAEAKDNGVRRQVLDGPTATLDRLHAHITTLKPGERSGEPSRHLQEEVIIVREGTLEASFDGQARTAGPGSVIFFASNAVTSLRNVGPGPATYTVVYYYTPLTPKN